MLNNTTMQALFVILILASSALAVDQNPLTTTPYCVPINKGIIKDPVGTALNFTVLAYDSRLSNALFINGQNNNLDMNWWFGDPVFFSVDSSNQTLNLYRENGTFWDFGSDYWDQYSGFGLIDGSYDTVDGSMSIFFDGESYGIADATTTCNSDTSFTLSTITLPNGLELTRTFYVPKGYNPRVTAN